MASPSDPTWYSDVKPPIKAEDPDSIQWDEEVDVAVVGFGGAGASAAIEAADNGAKVMAIDRFQGGGATGISGGVYYAGGGTPYQKTAGVEDTPDEMFKYLSMETKGVVHESTLRKFCDESVKDMQWLEEQNVPFEGSLCPYKTSYPTNRHRLYFSGNESVPEFAEKARPAQRGHIAAGKRGFRAVAGPAFFNPLKETAIRKGVVPQVQSRVRCLVTDKEGTVVGLELQEVPQGSLWSRLHKFFAAMDDKTYRYVPAIGKLFRRGYKFIERKKTRAKRIRALCGVILSAGGFVYNRSMVRHYAPKYLPGLPLGTAGDDGSGIRLGESVGGAADRMDRVSAWRFINPPLAWSQGIIVNSQGERYCDEMVYGARLGERMCEDQEGKAILVIDKPLFRRALKEILPWKVMIFQLMAAASNMFFNAKKAATVDELAGLCKMPAEKLRSTVDAYNVAASGEGADSFGKPKEYLCSLKDAPFYAMDVSADSKLFPCPMITFGGLVVDEDTGQVKRDDGSVIPGLYAAGRTAVGIPSNSYVSGLSIADCVFSGRRAGRHAAQQKT